MILAVDSSGATAVALVDESGVVVAEHVHADPRAHAEAIGPLLAAAFEDLAAFTEGTGGELTAVAYGTGPGPFTGLRVGIAAARVVALARDLPELPVLSHDAVALAHLEAGGTAGFQVVGDARRREVYRSRYAGLDADGLPVRMRGPEVGPPDPGAPDAVPATVSPGALGRLAVLRRNLGLLPEPPEPRYLRAPDVTLSARKPVGT